MKIFIILALLCVGCTQKELDDNLGQESSASTKNSIVSSAFGPLSVSKIYKGEFALVEYSQRAFAAPAVITGAAALDVLERTDFDDGFEIKLLTRNYTFNADGSQSLNKYVDDLFVEKQQVQGIKSKNRGFLSMQYQPNVPSDYWDFSPCQEITKTKDIPTGYRVAYFNLKKEVSEATPPQLVQEAPNCGDVPGCKIKVTSISYDEVVFGPTGEKEQYNCSMVVSPDVPYLSGLMKKCYKFMAVVSGRNIPVESCMNAVNFRFGKPGS